MNTNAAKDGSASPARKRRSLWIRLAGWLLWLWALVPWSLMAVHLYQPAQLAALTIVPAWCWLLFGAQITGPVLIAWRRWSVRAAVVGWALFAVLFVGELRSLARGFTAPEPVPADAIQLRIVTLNCKVGNPVVYKDLQRVQPDLVLLQESPQPFQLRAMSHLLWKDAGAFVHGRDCSMIARGPLKKIKADPKACFTQAVWQPQPGVNINVFSLRLAPMPVEFRFWRSRTREKYARKQQEHTEQVGSVVRELAGIAGGSPIVVGGDFNSPAGDRCEWGLRQRLRDSFHVAGRSWGNTILNEFPFHRIDRIWLSHELNPINVRAIETMHSDHRMVVCDVYLSRDNFAKNTPAAEANASSAAQNSSGQGLGQSPSDETRSAR